MASLCRLLLAGIVGSTLLTAPGHAVSSCAPPDQGAEGASEAGWTPLFDGHSLDGWKGDGRYWSVEDGCIVGRSTPEVPCSQTTYLHYVGERAGEQGDEQAVERVKPGDGGLDHGRFRDFEVAFEIKLEGAGANSGLQYRSTPKGPGEGDGFDLSGYQADIDAAHAYTGILYETYGRGITVGRGEAVRLEPDGSKRELEPARADLELKAVLEKIDRDPATGGWHHYRVVAKGRHLEHWIDGERFMLAEDDGPQFSAEGIFALQVHQGPPMTVRVRNIRVRSLDAASGSESGSAAPPDRPATDARPNG